MAQSIVFRKTLMDGIHLDDAISSCHFNLGLIQSQFFNAWFRRFKIKNHIPDMRAVVQYANSNFLDDFKFSNQVLVEMDFMNAKADFMDIRFRFYEGAFDELRVIVIQRMTFERNNVSYALPVHVLKQFKRHLVEQIEEEFAYV